MDDIINYVEDETRVTANFHIDCAETLMRESNILLTINLSGAGGALALFISMNEEKTGFWLQAGTLATSCYLFLITSIVVWKCLRVRPIFPTGNEPKHLLIDGFELHQIRTAELKNKQRCIDANRLRNDSVGFWLNRLRFLTTATPIVFILTAFLVAC